MSSGIVSESNVIAWDPHPHHQSFISANTRPALSPKNSNKTIYSRKHVKRWSPGWNVATATKRIPTHSIRWSKVRIHTFDDCWWRKLPTTMNWTRQKNAIASKCNVCQRNVSKHINNIRSQLFLLIISTVLWIYHTMPIWVLIFEWWFGAQYWCEFDLCA